MRRAKIVATLGPATSSLESIRALVAAGMDVARLNLSHGRHEDHLPVYQHVRQASDEAGRGVGILVDLQGPKIRLGRFASGPVLLESGAEFIVTTDEVPGDSRIVSTTLQPAADAVAPQRGLSRISQTLATAQALAEQAQTRVTPGTKRDNVA